MLPQLERTFFNVTKRANESDLGFGLYNDLGQKISDVSAGYRLINNRDLVKPLVDRFGEDSVKRIYSYNGRKNYAYEIETGSDIVVADGDVVKQRLLILNSYDKSKSFRFILGAFRSYCFNGLFNGLSFANIQKAHVGVIDVEGAIQTTLNRVGDLSAYSHWSRMAQLEVKEEAAKEFIKNFSAYDAEQGTENADRNARIRLVSTRYNEFRHAPKERETAWGLYNRMNWSIARVVRTNNVSEYVKINNKLEESLLNNFQLN